MIINHRLLIVDMI